MKRMFLIAAALAAASCARADSADEALVLARRTYDYVAKSVDAKALKPYARELAADAAWLASASNAPSAYRQGIERAIRELRRRILFLHPDLQFDKLIAVQRGLPYTWDLHMVDQYVGRFSRPGPGLVVLENWKASPGSGFFWAASFRREPSSILTSTGTATASYSRYATTPPSRPRTSTP